MSSVLNSQIREAEVDLVDKKSLDSAAEVMLKNDLKFLPQSGIKPTVWCCKWYNTRLNDYNRSQFAYKKGDAVWMNTEHPTQFAVSHQDYIRNVCTSNSELAKLLAEAEAGASSELVEFYRKIVVGEIIESQDGLPLYCLGDVEKPVQIRVSTADDNTSLPTDDRYWKDFFVSQDTSKFKSQILEKFASRLSDYLSSHISEYHLSGMQTWLRKSTGSSSLSAQYLLKTLDNVTKHQEYTPGNGVADVGFDYVVYFQQKRSALDPKAWKWFRVWKSGYLEHGGIISKDPSVAASLGDELVCQSPVTGEMTHYQVNLQWSYGSGNAPAYTYPVGSGSFYFENDKLDLGDAGVIALENQDFVLDPASRYQIQITPASSAEQPYSTMHPVVKSQTFGVWYVTREANTIRNESFRFVLDDDSQYYTYYTSGFGTNAQRGF